MTKNVRDRIVAAMERRGITAAELARRANVSYNVVTKLRHRPDSSTSAENAEKLLAVLQADADFSSPILGGGPPPPTVEGFAEFGIGPWTPRNPMNARTIVSLLAPRAAHPATYLLSQPIHQFYLDAGDVLIIDLKGAPKNGDLVIASRVDNDMGDAETIIGRLITPHIVPPGVGEPPWLIDSTITIRGPVISSFRNPDQ